MACPDANTLLALLVGELAPAQREAVHAHTDGCDDCRQALAALVRDRAVTPEPQPLAFDTTIPTPQPEGAVEVLAPGTTIGRYAVEARLGAGGLGIVYAARDPELGRRVALKLLKHGREEQARLLREAQAMARVSHPNVVAVYDVGRHQERVFLAMEVVEGGDLRGWLAADSRSIAEVVDAFRAAGRGLAAAHAAGLVHRDFKPDNVLVAKDGRVRVTDFGLSRAVDQLERAPEPSSPPPADGVLSTPLTHSGTILGTPAYMAPEQHEGGHVDARSDQFAFCVALYEALFGERPFAGSDYPSLRGAVLAGRVRPSQRRSRVPASLRRIVLRGLAVRPGDRWPTMDDLLMALGRDRAKAWRRIAWLAAGVLAVVATAGAGDWVVRTRLYAATRASFAATRVQIGLTLALRYETFATLARVSSFVPIVREVAATRDQSDFGFARPEDDARQLARLHDSLRAADWEAWGPAVRAGLAVADYKGRLLYATTNPDAVGGDVRSFRAVVEATRQGGPGMGVEVIRADDPRLLSAGLATTARPGLQLLFVRALVGGDVAQATFIQAIDARHFLAELTSADGSRLALVTIDGTADGDVHPDLVAAGRTTEAEIQEVAIDGHVWLAQGHPVPGIEPGSAAIATLVMARPADVGLAGLFPHARAILIFSALVAFVVGALALLRARSGARS